MRSSRWRSPSSFLLPLLVAMVETAAVAPLLALLDALADQHDHSRSPQTVVVGLIGLLAFGVTRLLEQRGASLRVMRIVLLAGFVLALVMAIPAQGLGALWQPDEPGVVVLAGVGTLIAWWRGMTYGNDPEPFSADRLTRIVQMAWIVLAGMVMLVAAIDGVDTGRAEDALRLAIPVAAIAGMMLLALGQIEEARVTARRKGGRAPERRGWLLFALIFAVLLMVIATLGSAVLGGDAARWILTPLGLLLDGVTLVLQYLLIGLAMIFFVIFYPLIWLLRKIRADEGQEQQEQQGAPGELQQLVQERGDGLPHAVQTATQIGAVVLIVAVVALLLVLSLRKYRRPAETDDSDEERESLWSRDLASAQLRGLFRRGGPGDSIERIDLTRPPQSVREAYRALQALATRDGVGRRDAETPSAFAARLRAAWPQLSREIDDLTHRYERVRYGNQPDAQEREGAQRAWGTIWEARRVDPKE